MGVCFYLKPVEKSTGKSLIVLQYKYNGRKLLFSFGQTISPAAWSKKRQRLKSNQQTTADGDHYLNDLLDNLQDTVEQAYKKELANGIPEPATLKQHLVAFLNQNKKEPNTPTFRRLLERFISGEIKYKGHNKSSQTLKKYGTLKGHLDEFESKKRYPIDFNTITLDFFYKYVSFLQEKGLAKNSIAKDIQIIKTIMNEATELEYTTNRQFKSKKFSASWEEVDAVYLKDAEIIKLYKKDLSDKKSLERVRDLFVFGCYTGLRFSDYSNVKPENIISIDNEDGKPEPYIKMVTKKVGETVVIPCNPIILELFDKYKDNKNRLPKAPSNQKFNNYIKDACKEAGLKETGRLIDHPDKELWECVSSHTARRSFATNLFLEGYPTIELMKATGHRTERSFLKYIKVSRIDSAKRLNAHIKRRWGQMLYKAS